MNRILVPIDFSPSAANTLRFAHAFATQKDIHLTLLYCYPFSPYQRKYDFGGQDYDKGIREMLKSFYKEHITEHIGKTKFLARMGSMVDKVIQISAGYRLVMLSANNYQSTYQRWIGSKAATIASNANCPVLVIPPGATFNNWENIWHFKRKLNESKNVSYWLKKSELGELTIKEKTLNQTSFNSIIWKAMVSYIKAPKEELRQIIIAAHPKENIDLIVLVSHANDTFQKFLDDEAMQIVFEFEIPVLIFQAKLI